MQTRRLIPTLIISLAALIAPANALAQSDFRAVEREARQLEFERRPPFAGLSEMAALSRVWSVNTFYSVFRRENGSQTLFWAVRRETGDSDGSKGVVWADSRSCPVVEITLVAMEQLPSPRPEVTGLGQEPAELIVVGDGVGHIFWTRSAVSGSQNALGDLEITGNVNSPIAEWWARSADRLSDCWTATPPA